jgi:hypothetical protein
LESSEPEHYVVPVEDVHHGGAVYPERRRQLVGRLADFARRLLAHVQQHSHITASADPLRHQLTNPSQPPEQPAT